MINVSISAKYSGERQPQMLNNLDILDILLHTMNLGVYRVYSVTKRLVAQYLAIVLFCHMLKKTFIIFTVHKDLFIYSLLL